MAVYRKSNQGNQLQGVADDDDDDDGYERKNKQKSGLITQTTSRIRSLFTGQGNESKEEEEEDSQDYSDDNDDHEPHVHYAGHLYSQDDQPKPFKANEDSDLSDEENENDAQNKNQPKPGLISQMTSGIGSLFGRNNVENDDDDDDENSDDDIERLDPRFNPFPNRKKVFYNPRPASNQPFPDQMFDRRFYEKKDERERREKREQEREQERIQRAEQVKRQQEELKREQEEYIRRQQEEQDRIREERRRQQEEELLRRKIEQDLIRENEKIRREQEEQRRREQQKQDSFQQEQEELRRQEQEERDRIRRENERIRREQEEQDRIREEERRRWEQNQKRRQQEEQDRNRRQQEQQQQEEEEARRRWYEDEQKQYNQNGGKKANPDEAPKLPVLAAADLGPCDSKPRKKYSGGCSFDVRLCGRTCDEFFFANGVAERCPEGLCKGPEFQDAYRHHPDKCRESGIPEEKREEADKFLKRLNLCRETVYLAPQQKKYSLSGFPHKIKKEMRKCPQIKSTTVKAGKIMIGQDGHKYQATPNSRGIHYWKRIATHPKPTKHRLSKSFFSKSKSKSKLRQAPARSATTFPLATIKIGQNGKKWQVILTSNGVKRWKQMV